MKGSLVPMLASFLAGVIVHMIASSRYRSRVEYVPGKGGRNEAAHWRPDGFHDFEQPGIIGRLLGQDT
jgi:hypothetical protein